MTVMSAVLMFSSVGCLFRTSAPPVNPQGVVFKEFSERILQYSELQKKLEATLPPLKNGASADEVAQHSLALADKIRAARPSAKQGDIFSGAVAAEIRRILRNQFNGDLGMELRAAIRDNNPQMPGKPSKIHLRINASYPVGVPVSSVPPSTLLNLPNLPPALEYRFAGRHLILLDASAHLIVDYLWEAVPRL